MSTSYMKRQKRGIELLAQAGSVNAAVARILISSDPYNKHVVANSTATLADNATVQLYSSFMDAANNVLSGVTGATWTSGNTSIATVNSSGLVQWAGAGTTTITLAVNSVTSTTFTVTCGAADNTVATVVVTPNNPTIAHTTTEQFTATAYNAEGRVITGQTFTWASSVTGHATINSSGLATGVAAGTTVITATDGSVVSAGVTLTLT